MSENIGPGINNLDGLSASNRSLLQWYRQYRSGCHLTVSLLPKVSVARYYWWRSCVPV
jgi:hypothetical protein